MELEKYLGCVVDWMSSSLPEEVFSQVSKLQYCSFDELNRAENKTVIQSLNNEHVRNFFNICLLKSIVVESKQECLESGIWIINNIKNLNLNLVLIEKRLADYIINSTNFNEPAQIELHYNFLKQIDTANIDNNLSRLASEARNKLVSKKDENFNFVEFIKGFNSTNLDRKYKEIVNEFLEQLLFGLILITRKGNNLKQFLLFKAVYEAYYNIRLEEINKSFNALIAENFKNIIKSSNEIPCFDDICGLGQRVLSGCFLYYKLENTKNKYLSVMTDAVLINMILEKNKGAKIVSFGAKVSSEICLVAIGLNQNLVSLHSFLQNQAEINSITYTTIFKKILEFYVSLKEVNISFCFHSECAILDDLWNVYLLPSQPFCFRPKDSQNQEKSLKNFKISLSLMMQENLVYLNKQDRYYSDIESSVKIIRENEELTIDHILEYLSNFTSS